jgi:hypothetical protein
VYVGAGGGSGWIKLLEPETVLALPAEFVAVSRTRSLWPTSVAARRYAFTVAPGTLAQLASAPVPSQRYHWYVIVGAGLPVKPFAVTLSVCPCSVWPSMNGTFG